MRETNPFFSIIVVCLNPGEKLQDTLESIRTQQCMDYEIILKDGMSTDGTIEGIMKEQEKYHGLSIHCEKDSGIYDAMNQAIQYGKGKYLFFLNCGDLFYSAEVLRDVQKKILENEITPDIVYGNSYNKLLGVVVNSAPSIDGFTCYRNVPCHQTCFYRKELFSSRGYNTKYRVRADYEHFLWCFYEKKAVFSYLPVIVSYYEGGGFSETKKNIKRSKNEHKEITSMYMSGKELFHYKFILAITLAPLRRVIANQKTLGKVYHHCKRFLYGRKKTS